MPRLWHDQLVLNSGHIIAIYKWNVRLGVPPAPSCDGAVFFSS